MRKVLGNVDISKFSERLTAQKLIYIAQKLFGINFGYSFKWYVRGPYSRSLSRDLREPVEECKCSYIDEETIITVKSFIKDLERFNGGINYQLEIIASYLMLNEDVYPKPIDPIKELASRKPYLRKEDIINIVRYVDKYKSRKRTF